MHAASLGFLQSGVMIFAKEHRGSFLSVDTLGELRVSHCREEKKKKKKV